jgi:RHS repeat-associated protein
MVQKASGYASGFTFLTTGRSEYDGVGRTTAVYDGNGNKTTTAYTDDAVGLSTSVAVTNPLNQAKSTTMDPQRGLQLVDTDINGVKTSLQFDALGRLTGVWLHNRATTSSAHFKYTYALSNSSVTSVTTQRLNDSGGYITSTTLYDAQLRARQTQNSTPQGGRLVTDTFYDSRGWVAYTYNGWWDAATTPNATLVSATDLGAQVPNQDYFTYDGLGRKVIDKKEKNNTVVSSTTTVYNGDRTTVIPPTGGTVKTTVVDPLGRTSQQLLYKSTPTVNVPTNTFTGVFSVTGGASVPTTYGFDGHGNQSTVTDTQSHTWTTTYDVLGNITAKSDPDSGTASGITYDNNGNVLQATDARAKTVSYTYDKLNRRTGMYTAPVASQSASNQPGMTYPLGHQTSSTSFSGGAAYVTRSTGFNVFGKSLGETYVIPSATEGSLLGQTYTFTHQYTANTGLILKDIYAALGGLPAETVTHGYVGSLTLPNSLGGLNGYANGVSYDAWGRVTQQTIGSATNKAYLTTTYDDHSGRVKEQLLTRPTGSPTNVDDQVYSYDLAGNVTKQVSTRLGAATPTETQCFAYDKLAQLSAAWTATDACAGTPSTGNRAMVGDSLGTASAYWTTWVINDIGNRTSQTDYSTTGGSDVTTTFSYDGAGKGQPHTLTATTGGAGGSTSYGYDAAGNMTSRNAGRGAQVLNWDDAGRLTSVTGGTPGSSSTVYDADGNVLVQRDPGTTTLYIGTEQIALNTASQTITGTRYYQLPGGQTAIRTGSGTNYGFAIGDWHASPSVYLDSTAQTPTWRQFAPYGAVRGSTSTWIDNHGFLNQPTNGATGLTHLGAREYDPAVGRFISDDAITDDSDPLQINGYSYANNSPTILSDPSGNRPECGSGLDSDTCDNSVAPAAGSTGFGSQGNGGGTWTNNHGAGPTREDLAIPAFYGAPMTMPQIAEYNFNTHISNLDEGDMQFVYDEWVRRNYKFLYDQQVEEGWHDLNEELSWIPVVGAPSSVELAREDWSQGKYWSAAIGVAGILPVGKAAKAAKFARELAGAGTATTDVYIGIRAGQEVNYAGISKNPAARAAQHRATGLLDDLRVITPTKLTRAQARAVEQALIERFKASGASYLNKINSISPQKPYYNQAVTWGNAWLQANGL